MVPLRIDEFFNFIKMSLKAGNIFKKTDYNERH